VSYAHYLQGATVQIDGRSAGYPDVVDASGKVLIPAEAFVWGGRLSTAIPDSDRATAKSRRCRDVWICDRRTGPVQNVLDK